VQAFVVLGLGEVILPSSITGGQGSLSMWTTLLAHPGLWLNALVNSVYWLALAYLLREPLGAILIVLAFLTASFLVDPLQWAVGIASESHITVGAAGLGLLGAAM
jgi:hypothetical protein